MTQYVTLQGYKSRAGINDTEDDAHIEGFITAASAAIDDWCGRPEGFSPDSSATARLFYPDSPFLVYTTPISSATGLIVKTDENDDGTFETTFTSNDYQLEPLNALADGWPALAIRAVGDYLFPDVCQARNARPSVQVTAKWGWPAVPTPVEQACYILTQDLYKMKDVSFGASTNTLTEFGPLRVSQVVNRIAASLLSRYRDPGKVLA